MAGTLGPYELRGELGRGAMAMVWRGYDPNIEREVAIKEPLTIPGLDSATAAEMGARFVREGKTAGKLNHPGIVTIYNADIYAGRPAIVMELIEGRTLGDVIDGGRPSAEFAVSVLDQLLDAVAYAHSRGVVHRDIKPDNVFVTAEGRVKLTDFGIASVTSGGTLTQAGQVLGTPGYMAPEQVLGQPVDGRADLFAIGVMAYEMLTGVNPFGATDGSPPTTILYRVVHEDPAAATSVSPEVPGYLAGIIARALAKDPNARYQSAEEMRADLRSATFTAAPAGVATVATPVAPAPHGQRPGKQVYVAAAAAVVVVLAVLGVVFSGGSPVTSGGAASTAAPAAGPVVAFLEPADGASVKVGQSLRIRVDGGGAERVSLKVNGESIATLEKPPFEASFTPAAAGDYTVVAEGSTGAGAAGSATRTFTAGGGASPAPAASGGLGAAESEVRSSVDAWLGAWRAMDFGLYMRFYADDFHSNYKGRDGASLGAWRDYKRGVFAGYSSQRITVADLRVRAESDTRVAVTFMQTFDATKGDGSPFNDYGFKSMVWTRQADGRWLISQEEWSAR